MNRRDFLSALGLAAPAAVTGAGAEAAEMARLREENAALRSRGPIILQIEPTCECVEPVIKCNMFGCRCMICGWMQR